MTPLRWLMLFATPTLIVLAGIAWLVVRDTLRTLRVPDSPEGHVLGAPEIRDRWARADHCGHRWSDGWGPHVCYLLADHDGSHLCKCDAPEKRR